MGQQQVDLNHGVSCEKGHELMCKPDWFRIVTPKRSTSTVLNAAFLLALSGSEYPRGMLPSELKQWPTEYLATSPLPRKRRPESRKLACNFPAGEDSNRETSTVAMG